MTIRTLFASWRHLRYFEHWITTEGDAPLQPTRVVWERRPFTRRRSRTNGAAAGFPQAVLGWLGLRGQPPSFGQRGEVHPRQGRLENWLSTPRCLRATKLAPIYSTRCKYKLLGSPTSAELDAAHVLRAPPRLCLHLTWIDSQASTEWTSQIRGQTDKENGRKPLLWQQSSRVVSLMFATLYFSSKFNFKGNKAS